MDIKKILAEQKKEIKEAWDELVKQKQEIERRLNLTQGAMLVIQELEEKIKEENKQKNQKNKENKENK